MRAPRPSPTLPGSHTTRMRVDRERQIIAKVQGLLRLAENAGATEAEAALAAERAQALMRKYAIDSALLAEETPGEVLGVDRVAIEIWVREWRLILAVAAAETVAGRILFRTNRVEGAGAERVRTPGEIEFFLPEGTGASVLALFRFLEDQCARVSASAAADAGPMSPPERRRWRAAWLEGASARIAERLAARREADDADAHDDGDSGARALVLLRDRVDVAVEEAAPHARADDTPPTPRGRGYVQGFRDGGQLDLGGAHLDAPGAV